MTRTSKSVRPSRPQPLRVEYLEGRYLPSATGLATDPPAEAPQDRPPVIHVGHDHQAAKRSEDESSGRGAKQEDHEPEGLGPIVSAWTHEGIHGQELAALIHVLRAPARPPEQSPPANG